MDTIFDRLREERARLGLSQQAMADLGRVQRRAQTRYESGERCPDGLYLSALAEGGVDVQYVLTGRRGNLPGIYSQTPASSPLAIREGYPNDMEELVINWSALTESQRREVIALVLDRVEMNELKAEVASLKKTSQKKVSTESTKVSRNRQNGDVDVEKDSKSGRGR
jgi:transcriptional regulator with XRE-family HTH domain